MQYGESLSDFQGTVSGIDVIATPGQALRCLAFVSRNVSDEIQVTTDVHALQTALELAAAKRIRIEVSYEADGLQKRLTRVRLLDRDEGQSRSVLNLSGSSIPANVRSAEFDRGLLIWAEDRDGNAVALAFDPR